MEVASLIVSITALVVSAAVAMWGWWRHRNVYDVERTLFFRQNEAKRSDSNAKHNTKLKEKLNSGHYTILHTGEYGGYIELILGKIKK